MKKTLNFILGITFVIVLIFACKTYKAAFIRDADGKIKVNPNPSPSVLSPEESMRSMAVQKGYHLELVASEPMISEPVAIVWDGNGKMFVAEMNTYMQDLNGTGQKMNTCKIKLLEDTDGDGKMDKATLFLDSLVLPRMMLCLDDKLLVNETFTNNIYSYRDTNGDGHSDEKLQVFEDNSPDEKNLEHQKTGLIWNLDNKIYLTVSKVRYSYEKGKLVPETLYGNPIGQWGLGNDNYGRLYFSSAGGEKPILGFQQNNYYGNLDLKDQYDDEFQEPWPIIATPDVQGGLKRLRPDSTLNHFTSSNGQSIYRGDALPADLIGDYIVCEPVGRIIRRAKVIDTEGKMSVKNAYFQQEFIASADMNFRPVNTATGPDGCLYIVDMYHGIIQESNWTKEGSYLRTQILRKGLEKNVGRGRIYRVVADKIKPKTKKPDMLDASSSKLVGYLNHPNGWWRDNAQKSLVLRNDKSIVPQLETLVKTSANPLAKIHALWTLNGMHSLTKELLVNSYKDADAQVRKTAVWASEYFMGLKNNSFVLSKLDALKTDPSAGVRFQLALSLRFNDDPKAQSMINYMLRKYPNNDILVTSVKTYQESVETEKERIAKEKLMNQASQLVMEEGASIFNSFCNVCHGVDGKGISSLNGELPAPILANNKNVSGNPTKLIKVLLRGLNGPIDGKTYTTGLMPALQDNDDKYIASVLSYIRNNFGNKGKMVTEQDVAKIRTETANRTQPYTIEELNVSDIKRK
ncbi:MAG: cytochrome C [Oligoflexus sp.]|nr:cytochrome C [Pseudopedobacter sp.]